MSMASHLLGASLFFFHEITQTSELFQLFEHGNCSAIYEKTQKKTGATFEGGSLSMEATTKRLKKVTCVFFPSLEMHHGWIDYTDIRRGSVAKNPAWFLIKYVITCSNDLNLFWTDRIYEQKASHTFWYWTCKNEQRKTKTGILAWGTFLWCCILCIWQVQKQAETLSPRSPKSPRSPALSARVGALGGGSARHGDRVVAVGSYILLVYSIKIN